MTDGVDAAIERALAAANGKDVLAAGGATVVQQVLRSGHVDEMQIHLSPVLLGGGTRLFDDLHEADVRLEPTRVIELPAVTHLRFRVLK